MASGFRTYLLRHKTLLISAVCLALICAFVAKAYTEHQFRVVYSLDAHKNDKEIISLIDQATEYVYFAIYTFTKDDIADALVRAKKRGLIVEGIVDRGQAGESFEQGVIKKLVAAGILIATQAHEDGIMHIKAIVTDAGYASGSYNWTASATNANDELLEIGTNGYVHDQYLGLLKKIIAANKGGAIPVVSAASTSNPREIRGTYDYAQAKNHIGEYAAVTGRIAKVYTSKSGTIFFDYCSSYKTCPFSAVIFASAAREFANIKQYQGKTLVLTGEIREYQGKAEIVIESPEQITVSK
ncbi:MAG: phospholipase D-like domain-containing protein [bacterium]